MDGTKKRFGCLWLMVRWNLRLGLAVLLLLFGLFCGAFAPQLYHHFYLFPKQAQAWKDLAAQRTPVSLKTGWNEYRGVMHSHSEVSHDSEATVPEIAAALHIAKCNFIFMSDHTVDGKADFSLGKKGLYDDILFVRGFEMREGLMPWGLPDNTVLNGSDDPYVLARQVRELGGVMGFAHCEAGRDWDIPEIDCMEIYNIHTDLLDELIEKHSRPELVKEFLLNMPAYGDQTLRYMFDPWVLGMLMQKWDDQSKHRKITAMAANDIHQNVGLRGVYTAEDTLLLLDTGHSDPKKKIYELKLNVFSRSLLRCCFGKLEPGRQLFRIDGDPYQRSARFVNTHLLAKELTEPALVDALRTGRAFVAFNMLADAEGFAYIAEGGGTQATMGEQIALTPGLKLKAEAPLPCAYALYKDGKPVKSQKELGKTFEYEVTAPGKYRIQASIPVPGEMTLFGEDFALDMATWIIANPIEVTAAAQ